MYVFLMDFALLSSFVLMCYLCSSFVIVVSLLPIVLCVFVVVV